MGAAALKLEFSPRAEQLRERLLEFMDERVLPAEPVWIEQVRASADAGRPHCHPPVLEELKEEARRRGLWNMFLPDEQHGAGLTNVEYAPLAEVMGGSRIASEACNCSAPDTGNMEVLHQFGSEEQKAALARAAAGRGDPLGLCDDRARGRVLRRDQHLAADRARTATSTCLNGRKWWTTGSLHPNCRILIVMGKTDTEAPTYQQQSMILVPLDTPGVRVLRSLSVFGYHDPEGHGEISFEDVRVPAENIIAGEGMGFMIAQARLGPGRIHHCMRAIGAAERALALLCDRADARETFGKPVSQNANIRDWIAESRIELEMARLLVLKTAWLMDTVGNQRARIEIAAIKVAVPNIALKVVDRAIQVHGGGGVSQDFPLAYMYAGLRTLRLADGPDEVHKLSVARQELRRQRERRGGVGNGSPP